MAGANGADTHDAPAVHDDSAEVARRYAEALIHAAEKEHAVDEVLDELAQLERDVLKPNPRFAQVLASPRVSTPQKDRILVDLLENRASSLLLRFLRVLNRHERLGYLNAVARQARAIWDKRHKRVPVQVRSAVALDPAQLDDLRAGLARMTGATPILEVSIDPNLIAGLVVQVGDIRYDASAKSRLAQLRKRLIEGKTHEIQSRRDQFSHPA
jgi:F-type H+-transporting ATPase subunit delta